VPYADPLLWPFAGDKSPLRYTGGDVTVAQLMTALGVTSPPDTLDAYVNRVIDPTLARWAGQRAVAVKFLVAYARSLDFVVVERDTAAAIYMRAAAGTTLSAADEKALEDFLFTEIAARAGAH